MQMNCFELCLQSYSLGVSVHCFRRKCLNGKERKGNLSLLFLVFWFPL